ncbi:MAG TPA: neocarzinostatin apoprotein domain-containing protein [Solirubrobacterales bacterium]
MTSHLFKSFVARFALVGAIAAVMVGFSAAPAFAATVNATPDSELSWTEPTTLEVTGTEYAASTQYRVGLCSAEKYGFMGVPACSAFKTVTSNGSGNISTTLDVERENENVHFNIPPPANGGQPETFTCAGEEGDDICRVVVATHGAFPSILAGEIVTW